MERNICATLDLIDQALDQAIDGECREEFAFDSFDLTDEATEVTEFDRPILA